MRRKSERKPKETKTSPEKPRRSNRSSRRKKKSSSSEAESETAEVESSDNEEVIPEKRKRTRKQTDESECDRSLSEASSSRSTRQSRQQLSTDDGKVEGSKEEVLEEDHVDSAKVNSMAVEVNDSAQNGSTNGTNSPAELVNESHHNRECSVPAESLQSSVLKQPNNSESASRDKELVAEEQEEINSSNVASKVNESTDDDDVVQINAEPVDDLENNQNDTAQLDRGESPELNYSPDRDTESGKIVNRLKDHQKGESRDEKNASESEGSESDSGGGRKKGVYSSVSQVDSSKQRRTSGEGADADEEEGREDPDDQHQDDNDVEELKGFSENNDTQDIEEIPVASTFACLPRDQRKRRWGTCRTAKVETPVIISTDSLKELIPDVKPIAEDELKFSDGKSSGDEDEEEGEIRTPREPSDDELFCDQPVILDEEKPSSKKKEKDGSKKSDKHAKGSKEARKSSDKPSKKDSKESGRASSPEVNNKGKQVVRKISIISEEAKKLARPPTPSKHVPSPVLLITNLVRPFTILQLRELLQRTGKIKEGGFWIDPIKSKCYVEFENEDQAVETRHALHDVRWPVSNPKLLHVDFAKKEDLVKVQTSSGDGGNRKVENILADPYSVKKVKANAPVREWDVGKPSFPDEVMIDDRTKGFRGFEDVKVEHVRERERDRKDRIKDRDREKERDREREHERDRDRERDRKSRKERYGRSRSPEPHEPPSRRQRRKDDEAPAKLLDDLFCKTKALPCIYWLPLSSEQIAMKEEQRRHHIEELEKRMANNRERAKELFRDRDRERDKDRRKDRSRDRDHSSHRK